jgi:four helix bundle protein
VLKNFRTYQLAKEFYQECQKLKFKEPLGDQFERATLSIVLNLAEGSGKPSKRDRKKFYAISLGSLREVQAILDLTNQSELLIKADRLGANIYKLILFPGGSS